MRSYSISVARLCLVIGSTCLYPKSVQAQSTNVSRKPLQAYVEMGSFVVNDAMPFWLRANQYGIVPLSGSTGSLRIGVTSDYKRPPTADSSLKPKKVDWGYGLDLVSNAGQQNQLIIPEAYVKARWGQFELYAGRRRSIAGLVDTLLTSGSYAWSGNALPLPKIQLGTIGYVPVGFKNGFLSVNAFYNHGWFSDGFVRNSYLHQKAIYLRLGKPQATVKLYVGGNQEVQWGGYAPGLVGVAGLSDNMDGRFVSNLDAYYRVVTATSGTGYVPSQGVISIDQGNRIGNHLGSFDGGIEVQLSGLNVFAYRQNLYETGALFYLTNIADGLQGISIQRSRPGGGSVSVDRFLIEYFYSKSQGGSEFVIDDPQRRGRNNYFNHSQYQDGWIYKGRTIGTPFLTPQTETNRNLPQGSPIINNRVSLWHMGLTGHIIQRVQWLTKLSYSRNYGTYHIPFPVGTNQFSALLTLNTPLQVPLLGDCQLNSSFGLDSGKLLTNSFGCYIGLRKVLIK